jgi:phage-related protein
MELPDEERASIVAAMKEVQRDGLFAAKHLRGDLYAAEGRYGHVLLSLEVFAKKTRKTPPARLDLAQKRLRDWRIRGASL